ncbi:PHP domain-containing protein, partial [Streptomyces brasiliscabiei]|uniref:PHP domain-containing protein n=1 Tax=Streptomyces brasiliscabiei TaxID=2736302 RepID=UPI00301467B0
CNQKKDDFVHLHCHTHYSLQDALPSESALANAARERGQEAVAITDHGKMGGVIEFVKACRGKNSDEAIKPIIGCELYMCPDHTVKEQVMRDD